mmetsp:Transcript_79561/g.133286  ORF Transcript_79561/g.133286 Transcript_79561/m.133286 type:complete len:92 (-) Transcript_79561:1466-1741(-)
MGQPGGTPGPKTYNKATDWSFMLRQLWLPRDLSHTLVCASFTEDPNGACSGRAWTHHLAQAAPAFHGHHRFSSPMARASANGHAIIVHGEE